MRAKFSTVWKVIAFCFIVCLVDFFLIDVWPSFRGPSRSKTLPRQAQARSSPLTEELSGRPHSDEPQNLPHAYSDDFYAPVTSMKFKVASYREISFDDGEILDPRVSPEGDRIVLTHKRGKKNSIVLVNLVENRVTTLDLKFDDCRDPSWNASGDHIVFIGTNGSDSELFTYALREKRLTQITRDPARRKAWPRFSPYTFSQHYRIAYTSEKNGRKDIWWVRESGEYDQPLTLPADAVGRRSGDPYWKEMGIGIPISITEGGEAPEWSPSGNILLYRRKGNRAASLFYDYFTWWQHGALALPKTNNLLLWAPNQCSFLEYDFQTGKTFVVSRDALQKKEILPGNILTSPPCFFPDGKGLVFTFKKAGKCVLAVAPYEDSMGDIANLWMYAYTQSQKEKLANNKLIFLHAESDQIYDLYDTELYNENGGRGRPYLVTSDAVLETLYSSFSALMSYVERRELRSLLKDIATHARKAAASRRVSNDVRLWFSVGLALIDPEAGSQRVNDDWPEIRDELDRIRHASLTRWISLFKKELNYTDFFIRGKYERDNDLRNYFRTLKWFQAFTFDLKNSQDRKWVMEILSVMSDPDVASSLEKINSLQKNLIGESRYFSPLTLKEWKCGAALPVPTLQSPWIHMKDSFKLLPSLCTLDSFVFDELITHTDRSETVGTYENPRVLPTGLDLMAALGSEEARRILLSELNENRFANYEIHLDRTRKVVMDFPENVWRQTIYLQWLDLFAALLTDSDKAPDFTRTSAWKRKQLNAALGSWVGLRYETLAYVEQVAAEAGEGGYETINAGKPRGYVEPNPLFFQKLNAVLGRISEQFVRIIPEFELKAAVKERMDKYRGHLQKLEIIAQKELDSKPLTDAEYSEILYIGRVIEYFILINESLNSDQFSLAQPDPIRKVVDIQAASSGNIRLYEALGFANEINVIVPFFGKREIVKGPVYSYHEFCSGEQWTNEKWRQQKEYRLPSWIFPFYDGRRTFGRPGDMNASSQE
jgi:hypothetical protein